MVPSQFLKLRDPRGTGTKAKRKPTTHVTHLLPPLNGLSRFAETNESDPRFASSLTNFVVEQDRITVRPGYVKLGSTPGNTPVSTLVPFYGGVAKLAGASVDKFYDMYGVELSSGWSNDDWAFTSFSNLSSDDYTIMVNGVDGVVSWDGASGWVTETVTAPAGETWILPELFDKVLSHMNRLWFADSQNLAVYYLPVQQKSGTLFVLPLNAIFQRGGHIESINTWSVDGGRGMDDGLVIFSSNGECAIYRGVDPESDFALVGIFRFDAPMSKKSVINFGGDLYIMISTGFVPLTTLIRAETENLGTSDLHVMQEFDVISRSNREQFGWQVVLNHHTNHAICNMPLGSGTYQQLVRRMPDQVWTKWHDVPARCWGWLNNHMYFASDTGDFYLAGTEYLSDDGNSIKADVRFAWNAFRTTQKKNFKMVRLYTVTDGQPRPYIDMEIDYGELAEPINQPDLSTGPSGGADWDTADWDTAEWAMPAVPKSNWQGVTGLGRVAAPHIHIDVLGCQFSITGLDVLFETGGWM